MQQVTALSILKTGVNAFLTGEPGSGKTHTINGYVRWLRARGIEPAVTASTGIAATHIGGHTIHSWSGLGPRTELSAYDLEALHEKEHLWRRVNSTEVLIIEEVSMLDARAIESIDAILRSLRQRPQEAFGGMQVIFVGDFFQLPPVSREQAALFAYRSDAWRDARPVTLYLHEQHRQADTTLQDILSALRHQALTEKHRGVLEDRLFADEDLSDVTATKLYAHNADVDAENSRALAAIDAPVHTYKMETRGPRALVDQLVRGCLSPDTLDLKVGAVVMFTKNNQDAGYVNGTIGTVDDVRDDGAPIVATRDGTRIAVGLADWTIYEEGKARASIKQVPLRLAWAITVHKSQGMSLDAAVIDLTQAFEYGQGYVALSRVRSLDGLFLRGFNEQALSVHPDVAKQDSWFRQHSEVVAEKFGALSDDDVVHRQQLFVERCGGSWQQQTHQQKKRTPKTREVTRQLVADRMGLSEMVEQRQLKQTTLLTHIEELCSTGELDPSACTYLWEETGRDPAELDSIFEVFREIGTARLKPVAQQFGDAFSYEELRIARILYSGE
jgi:hypothetical protein